MHRIIVYKLSLVHDEYCVLEITLGSWISTYISNTHANACQNS